MYVIPFILNLEYLSPKGKPMSEKFWAVWREGGGSPNHRHELKEAAIQEASRLAQQTRESYYVLEVIGIVAPPDVPVVYIDLTQ